MGHSTTVNPVSQSVTDSYGRWVAKIPPHLDLSDKVDGSDEPSVNFFVEAWTPVGDDAYAFSVPETTTKRSPAVPMVDDGVLVGLDAAHTSATAAITLTPSSRTSTVTSGASNAALGGEPDVVTPATCTERTVKVRHGRTTKVDAYHSTAPKDRVWASFTFTKSASSQLGVGYSATGADGSFKADGSNSVSVEASQSYPRQHGKGNVRFLSFSTYSKIYRSCVQPAAASVTPNDAIYSHSYIDRPTAFEGGEKLSKASPVNYKKCRPWPKGSSFTQDKTKNYEFGAGVEAFGVWLSARTGWGTHTQLHFHAKKKIRICGHTNYPAKAQMVEVRRP